MSSIVDALNAKFGVNGENIADSISKITRGEGGGSTPTPTPTPTPSADSLFFPVLFTYDQSSDSYSADKTVFEIKNALDAGKKPIGVCDFGTASSIGPLANIGVDGSDNPEYIFQMVSAVSHHVANVSEVNILALMLNTNGVEYYDYGGDLIRTGAIGPTYNLNTTYEPGMYAMYDGNLYRCVQHNSGEAFDYDKWHYVEGGLLSLILDLMSGSGGDA